MSNLRILRNVLRRHRKGLVGPEKLAQRKRPGLANGRFVSRKIAARPNEKLIISVHIPKTGGTTFVEALRKCAKEVFYLDYGVEGPAPTALFLRGKQITASPESIISDLDSLPGRSVIHGHFPAKKLQ